MPRQAIGADRAPSILYSILIPSHFAFFALDSSCLHNGHTGFDLGLRGDFAVFRCVVQFFFISNSNAITNNLFIFDPFYGGLDRY